MAAYEKTSNAFLPIYKKFDTIDGKECLVNFVLLIEVDGDWMEFPLVFHRFKKEKPFIRTPGQSS